MHHRREIGRQYLECLRRSPVFSLIQTTERSQPTVMMGVWKAHLVAEIVLELKHHQDDSSRARKHISCLFEAGLCLEQLCGNSVQLLVRAGQQRLQVFQVLR